MIEEEIKKENDIFLNKLLKFNENRKVNTEIGKALKNLVTFELKLAISRNKYDTRGEVLER